MATPLMDQYHAIKAQHPGDILLFRLGDFYEMFYDDAHVASRVLGITLTGRQKGDTRIPMAGIPHHAATSYIQRLLRAGHRVAICEQTSEPVDGPGIVDRAVVRVITAGTLLEEGTLEERKPNYLAAVKSTALGAGLAWADVSTGVLRLLDLKSTELADELARLSPSETLTCGDTWPEWHFEAETAERALLDHFGVASLDGFGVKPGLALECAGALLAYLKDTCRAPLRQITGIETVSRAAHLVMNRQTAAALELTQTTIGGSREGSLLSVLDRTATAMGARLLREWLLSPLTDRAAVERRLDRVQEFIAGPRPELKGICDIERVLGRVGTGRVGPRDLGHLRATLREIPSLRQPIDDHAELAAFLHGALADELPLHVSDGGAIRQGFDAELDRQRDLATGGQQWLLQYEAEQVKRSGIPSLRVGYNSIFGYYIEITHANAAKVPPEYTRKQTLKNAERYITPELKEHESTVLHARDRALALEAKLFATIRERVAAEIAPLQETARRLAELDATLSLAQVAAENRYVRPVLDDSRVLDLRDSRHPTLEKTRTDPFVPNDVAFADDRTLLLITGPNMAGKSTYLRQAALLVVMAQMGSFVPAKSARIGLVDRLYVRAGAADELTRGASTFMVEMSETAQILNTATDRSLVVLDEIGRGTSTYDGVSLAWAIAEALHDRVKARTLFATHYHELTEIAAGLPRARNLHVAVREWGNDVVFLHRIVDGPTDRSYGLHVAKIAGIPSATIERAKAVLALLEASSKMKRPSREALQQLPLFQTAAPDPRQGALASLASELASIDIETLSPQEALQRLASLISSARDSASRDTGPRDKSPRDTPVPGRRQVRP